MSYIIQIQIDCATPAIDELNQVQLSVFLIVNDDVNNLLFIDK